MARRISTLTLTCFFSAIPPTSGPLRGGQAPADASARRPNILLLLSDDQRPDTIAALGNPVIKTPHLDSLVGGGTAFLRAVSPCPLCVPSRAELLTGCSGFRNGILPPYSNRWSAGLAFWPETMRDAGYHTWYVGKWHSPGRPSGIGYEESRGLFAGGVRDAPRGVDQHGREVTGYRGWVFQTDDRRLMPERGIGLTPGIDRKFADAAISFIRRKPDKPFFLHVNFTAPHDPLLMPAGYENKYPPEAVGLPPNFLVRHPFDHGNLRGRDELLLAFPRTEKDVREDLAVYYAVISHLDAQIGRILAALRETEQIQDTIIIFTSDHGLAMGSHGLRGKQNMYEHTVTAALILAGPTIPKDVRRSAQVYLRDLFPTVCELAGIDVPAAVQGRSIVPVLNGRSAVIHPRVFGYFKDVQRMVRTDRWKLIRYPKIGRRQLFDLNADPHEMRDLAGDPQHAEVVASLGRALRTWQEQIRDPLLGSR